MDTSPLARRALLPLTTSATTLGLIATFLDHEPLASLLWSSSIVMVTIDLVIVTVARLREGRVAVDVVALLALGGSLALGELLAGSVIAVMVASGETLEQHAHRRARRELSALLSLAPTVAHRRVEGGFETVPVEAITPGEVVLVKPGEVVPVDGIALESTVLDESVLTGESEPVECRVGDQARSGTVNAGGAVRLRAEATSEHSAYAGIVDLVRSAGVERAPFVRLADRYALVFVPVVLAGAGATWLVTGDSLRALAVLVVATPCPLVLAAPVAIVSGISSAARAGVVVKNGAALEALADARTVLVDKTGTLTGGRARLVSVVGAPDQDTAEILRLAASLEQASPHILAGAIVGEATARGLQLSEPRGMTEQAGAGVTGEVDGRQVEVGSVASLLAGQPAPWLAAGERRARREGCSTIAVSVDGAPTGLVLLTDELRTDTPRALRALRRAGVDRIVMVSGDRLEVATAIGQSVGVDQVFADRTPAEKVDIVRAESAGRPGTTLMVGDGVNDAPALAAADLGVAMGARGATASSEAADVVLVIDRLDRLATGIQAARRATAIARQSVLGGMGLSFAGMGLAAVGLLTPVAGAVAQEIIDVLAIANALRALRRPTSARTDPEVPTEWVHQLAEDHAPLRLLLEDVRATATSLDGTTTDATLVELLRLTTRIREELLPHERRDEAVVYPSVSATLAGEDPLASMSRTHQEIFHLAAQLDRLVTDAEAVGLDLEDRSEARRLLYALDAILRLHFAQEEELLVSLTSTAATT